jgi:hypothetical protein
MKLLLTGILLVLLNASAAPAAAEDEDLSCRNGNFASGQSAFGLAKVIGPDRLNFLGDMDGCPSEEARCRNRAYVVVGDVLLTGRDHGAYVCAFYPDRFDGDAGWVRRDRLSMLAVAASPPPAAWAGHWKNGDNTIALKAEGDALVADGEAYWPSAHPPRSDAPGLPNDGQLSGTARPTANRVVFSDNDPDGCTASLTLVGALLVVADNNNCGGMNVSFTGVYRRS